MTDATRAPSPSPALSVVVVVFAGPPYLERALRALAAQRELATPPEVIVAHDARLGDLSAMLRVVPDARAVTVDGADSPARLRAAGCAAARGTVVVCTEDHCVPDPDWCARILEAHEAPHAAIGGAVDKLVPDAAVAWAAYLSDYSRYMPPLAEGSAAYLTDCNVAYKRAALDAVADVWRDEFHETAVNWALRERGESLWLSPRIIVRQQRSLRLADALAERFEHGRIFATTRVARIGGAQRAAYAAAALLLPALLVARVASRLAGRRRGGWAFARALPALVALTGAWSMGELAGYLTGRAR